MTPLDDEVDRDRYEKLKSLQTERGRDEEEAARIAAQEVEELRRREGRSGGAGSGAGPGGA